MAINEEDIEKRLDRVVANEIVVSRAVGGVAIKTMGEVFEFAKMMAISGVAVPKHLRSSPGACLAICIQAFEWEMSPFAVANKSYSVNDRLAYESQLIHAVVEARAPLEKRLRDSYSGEGETRQCTITGTLKGDATPFTITSPKLKDIAVKNSPLWKSDLDQQLFYYTSRAWARRYVPDVLLGIYSKEEIEAIGEGPDSAVDVTPGLGERIAAGKDGQGQRQGFDAGNIDRALGLDHKPGQTIDASPKSEGEKVAVGAAQQEPKKKRSHHKAKDQDETRSTGTPEPGSQATNGRAASEGTADASADQGGAGERVEAGQPVGQPTNGSENITENITDQPVTEEELDQVAEEFPDAETTAQAYARETIEKVKAHLAGPEAPPNLERLREYKASMRKVIDGLEGLSADDLDVVRGQFSTIMLEAERAVVKKAKRR